jgi:ELWxxDGT repeat protein
MAKHLALFEGQNTAGGHGLWVTNGTAAGTFELTGIQNFGALPSGPVTLPSFTFFDGEVLFLGEDTSGDFGLWVTNGTAAGTHELTGISGAYTGGLQPTHMTVFSGEVLFAGQDASGAVGLWVTNGTAAGTHELTGISGANTTGGLNPSELTVFNGEVLFNGQNPAGQIGLWVTNGTAAGTFELTGISGASTGNLGLDPANLVAFNGDVLFGGYDTSGQIGLWVTNGTAAGTHELTGISGANTGMFGLLPFDMTVFSGEVLFAGQDASGAVGLWVTNGTAAVTHELTGISGASTSGLFASDINPDFTVFNGEVLFAGDDASGDIGLWVTNGTAAGTHELTGISGAYSGGIFAQTEDSVLTVFNGEVLFDGTDASGHPGLWVTNGTAAGTFELTGISGAATTGINPTDLMSTPAAAVDDFTGSDVSDALWRNVSGEVDTWLMNNGQMVGGTAVGTVSSAWQFAGTGDITGNGTSDVLWQNTATGEVDSWLINDGNLSGGTAIGHASSVWQPLGTGDFTGDGTADLLWRNSNTGEVDTWLMNNGRMTGGTAIGTQSSAWQFAGIGDFNDDGTSDVVWHNATTGEVDLWLMNNGSVSTMSAIGQASSVWQRLGAGDFNGDGTSDLLWLNTATGEVDTWLMNNGQMTGGTGLGIVSTAWQFAGIGDLTGNGTSDVAWRNVSTGQVQTWLIANDQVTGGSAIGAVSSAWQPQVIHTS